MKSEIKVLIFSVNDEYYATDIMEVERIINYEEPTKPLIHQLLSKALSITQETYCRY